ncbi:MULTISPECIES: restriction endonuclease subunit S [unclassified Citrobacter]|uniref:restriction endonuclease subunit S n=1 Tax=unclassified Citrobacter TaxID=2644389 RepID=UPI002575D0ED|nr:MULTISPECIES: restriction endonuclease subunit S [unclassified Citrobacter]MDM3000242.1 restriction endonuclease subunit S [Citrobacter sp. CK192]MDM3021751.1 restriction endonuclease subunit S [Citrobacter sp. CK193]
MSSKFRKVKLCEILSFKTGKLDSNAAVDNGSYPFFTCSPVTLSINTYAFDTEAVLLAGNNANGVFSVKYHNGKFNAYQRTYVITPLNNSEVNVKWLYFRIKYVTSELQSMSVGTATKFLTKKILDAFEIELPTFEEQTYQAQILWELQDKLANNEVINQTLEQMAQALFKSWFVDFEPVKAKIAVLESGGSQEEATLAAMTAISGKDVGSLAVFEQVYPEKYAELRSIAELFPSAMQVIESVKIPESWNLVPLSSIALFASGKIDVSELTKDTYISTENMLVNKMGIECATSLPSASTTPSFNPGHILISNIRPYFKKIWLARFLGGRSADVLAFEHKKNITAEYLYNVLYQDSFFDFMMQTSKGVKMPRGDKKAIMEWSCIEPTVELVSLFSNKVKEFYSYIESHNKENTQLSQLRDTLLPKLLSGEITLPEAEEIAKEADYV